MDFHAPTIADQKPLSLTLTFACELSVVFAGALVTADDTLDILIFDIADVRSVGAADRRRTRSCGVVVIVGCVVVIIIVVVGRQRSIGRAMVHAV